MKNKKVSKQEIRVNNNNDTQSKTDSNKEIITNNKFESLAEIEK